ncbi:hypothetical protein TPL01_24790 [Sulfuriferula plumbiphila]|uniref:Uncharacterized protein n=1 Tax=Sulfuriferula plumbiphila TaxID=171865 RepID=A0A512LB22_9PROT|nr:hypothetical protein [Sulfuriferula plumbiphila]BBP05697.1 hypothetical protein SFPGR_31190 [Sulfuriferula plumbiphila]GEP31341.1 hypothetical protein TPL01_24790 [Sulfuriferula plumbiphila]
MDNKIHDESQATATESIAKDSVANDARRRFTRTGLGAGAVIATLASQPVLGAVPYACTISGHASGNVSSHGQPTNCAIFGKSHGYWKKTEKHAWPSPFDPEQLFKDAGGVSGSLLDVQGITTAKTLLEVLGLDGGDMSALAREVVGAMLNAQAFAPDFPLSVAQVKSIWNEVVTYNQYTVKPGVAWTSEDVKNYLESLHDN